VSTTALELTYTGAVQGVGNAIAIFHRGSAADLRVGAGAQALGDIAAQLQHCPGLDVRQRLRIGVGTDEVNALNLVLDHVLDGVATAAAHADHFDDCIGW